MVCMPVRQGSPDRLTIRPSRLPTTDGNPPENDYDVRFNGETIGRIYRTVNRTPEAWFWGLIRFPSEPANSGFAPSLEEAKAALKARWERF